MLGENVARARHRGCTLFAVLALPGALSLAACGGGGGGDNGGNPAPPPPPPPVLEIVRFNGVATNGAAFQARILNLAAHGLAWDASHQLIYAAVPSTSAIHPRTVTALDPVAESIESSVAIDGGDPTVIRITDDASRLYVAVPVTSEVLRFALPGLNGRFSIALGAPTVGAVGPLYANDIATRPGKPGTIAVAVGDSGSTWQAVAVFDGAVQRANRSIDPIRAVAWSDSGSGLFGLSTNSALLFRYDVDSSGPVLVEGVTYAMLENAAGLAATNGRLQSNIGDTIDAMTLERTGWYPTPFPCLFATPPQGEQLVFALCGSDADPGGTLEVLSFDSQTFRQVARATIPGLDLGSGGFLRSHIRWGADGLAFMTPGNQMVLLNGPFVTSTAAAVVAAPNTSILTNAGISNAGRPFRVREMRIGAYDVVADDVRGRLYLSLGGQSTYETNSIAVMNPVSGRLLDTLSVGSDPNSLAITPDSEYLYVGIDGASSIRRIRLADRVVDATLRLGRDPRMAPYFARQIFTAPSAPRTVGVARSFPLDFFTTPADGVTVFDDATQRGEVGGRVGSDEPVSYPNGPTTTFFQWGPDASTIYGVNADTTGCESSVYSVDSDGLHYQRGTQDACFFNSPFVHVQGLLYSAQGATFQPDPMTMLSQVNHGVSTPGGASLGDFMVHYDGGSDRLFYFANSGNGETLAFWLFIVQRGENTPRDVLMFRPALEPMFTTPRPYAMARWGVDGIAVQLATGRLLLFDGEAIRP